MAIFYSSSEILVIICHSVVQDEPWRTTHLQRLLTEYKWFNFLVKSSFMTYLRKLGRYFLRQSIVLFLMVFFFLTRVNRDVLHNECIVIVFGARSSQL